MSTLNELYEKDPLDLTEEDLDVIITHLVEEHKKFQARPPATRRTSKLTAEDLLGT